MKLSLHWMNEFIDIQDYFTKIDELGAILTRAGLEVESVQDQRKQYNNVVVGYIIEKGKHPSADRLSFCSVDVGSGNPLSIVCGAQNHQTGDKVVVAQIGAVLPGDFKIQKSKIRGVESMGMLCSMKELGLPGEAEGIAILPKESQVGLAFSEYAKLTDLLLELKVTPNRADCLSHYGLARELSVLLGRPLKPMSFTPSRTAVLPKAAVDIVLQETENCPRYAGRVIEDIQVSESPAWMKTRLENAGFKSINSIVDVTNYVMLELGQPMHAFDLSQVRLGKILVRSAKAKEKFETLDGTNLELTGEELVISDHERVLAMAGVVGGKNSGVEKNTRNVFLESAFFAPQSVRRSSRKHGVQTESSYRFSRGVDPSMTLLALDRAAQLIQLMNPTCRIQEKPNETGQPLVARKAVKIDLEFLSQKLGYPAKADFFEASVKSMGCQVKKEGAQFHITPPFYRVDLEQPVDFVEEYARLFGYEHIPETLPILKEAPTSHDKSYVFSRKLAQKVKAMGLSQAFHMSFAHEAKENEFIGDWSRLGNVLVGSIPVKLKNPLSEDLAVMRRSLAFGLFENARMNLTRGNSWGGIFEIGKVFGEGKDLQGYGAHWGEKTNFGAVLWGQNTSFWTNKNERPLFSMKRVIEEVLIGIGIKSFEIKPSEAGKCPQYLHPFQSGQIVFQGQVIGHLGHLHPKITDENKIRTDICLIEMDLEKMISFQPKPEKTQPISKFQAVDRDLAFVVSKKVSVGEMMKELKKIAGPKLVDIHIFDLFEGASLGEGNQSVAFRMKLQDSLTTLTDEILMQMQNQMIEKLQTKFNCRLR